MTLVCRCALLQLISFIFIDPEFTVVKFICCCSSFGHVTNIPLSLDKKGVKSSSEPPALNPDLVEGKLGGVYIVGKIRSQVKPVFTIV